MPRISFHGFDKIFATIIEIELRSLEVNRVTTFRWNLIL